MVIFLNKLSTVDDLQVQSQLDLDASKEKDLAYSDGKDGEHVINDHEVPVVISKEGSDEVQNDDQEPELSVVSQVQLLYFKNIAHCLTFLLKRLIVLSIG